MKNLVFLLHFIFITSAFGQSTEYSIHLNSGLFSFAGESAVSETFINENSSEESYTNSPYGKNHTLSFGFAAQVQRVAAGDFIFGIQPGYEVLRSRVQINQISGRNPEIYSNPASGSTYFSHSFASLHPFLGYRFTVRNSDLNIDITAGPEFGYNLTSREKGTATTDEGYTVKTDQAETESTLI